MNLLHLISEQTTPNLLAILAFQPTCVLHLHSRDDRSLQAITRIERATREMVRARLLPAEPEFIPIEIPSTTPSVEESRQQTGSTLALWPGCIVNLTGGTKQMVIGAYLSSEYQREPSLYCDTQLGQFVSIGKTSCKKITEAPPLPEVAKKLTLEILLAAHGLEPDKLTFSHPTEDEIAFAHLADQIKTHHPDTYAALSQKIRACFYPGNGNTKIKESRTDSVIAAGLPSPWDDASADFYATAVRAGYVTEPEPGKFGYRIQGNSANKRIRHQAVQKIINFLTGGWFEVLQYDHLRRNSDYTDVRVGVQTRSGEHGFGENDIVAVNIRHCSLTFVSCKLSEAHIKLLEHVFAIKQRARQYGGSFSKALLAVHQLANPKKEADLRRYCAAADVALQIMHPSEPAPK